MRYDITRIAFTLCLVFAFAAVSCSRTKKEQEPNDTFAAASEITPGTPIRGFMDSASDRDLYVLEITVDRVLDLRLSGARGVNLILKVWRGGGDPRLVKWIDDNRKSSPERFANLAAGPGTWYVEVAQSERDRKIENRETPYELLVLERQGVSEESEPNDTQDEANRIAPGGEVVGYFSPAYNRMNNDREALHREEDWYVMEASVPSDSPAIADISLSGVDGVNSLLKLIDAGGNEIASSDAGGNGGAEAITGVGLPKSGSYYLMVAAKSYTANNDQPYALSVTMRRYDPGIETERNDDPDSANEIVNNVISGRINAPDDRDYFRYVVEDAGLFRIELRPPEGLDLILSIHGGDRSSVIDVNNAGPGGKEIYPNYFAEREFIIATAARGGVSVTSEDYVLTVTPLKIRGGYEREPNDESERANPLAGSSMTGYISHRGDRDFFILTRDDRTRETFEIRGVKGGAIKVSITDPLGYIIKSVDIRGDRKAEFTEMIDRKGYLIVEASSEHYDHPYIIQLRGRQ